MTDKSSLFYKGQNKHWLGKIDHKAFVDNPQIAQYHLYILVPFIAVNTQKEKTDHVAWHSINIGHIAQYIRFLNEEQSEARAGKNTLC